MLKRESARPASVRASKRAHAVKSRSRFSSRSVVAAAAAVLLVVANFFCLRVFCYALSCTWRSLGTFRMCQSN